MSEFEQKHFTTYSKHHGRDPQICRDAGGHWVNPRMKQCNNCGIRLQLHTDGTWVEHTNVIA